ncbi:28S ribosomal protein S31, mitochondrial [Microplitis mediator]|uniref:28S ribosomal protein S31, mitochondrial n=1 Tax=Microplitis mediator TaxID=375433 RepID=UPI0025537B4C|nr:28S ribosomal protein S31, mitochondrial [Microplitis mediator]
MNNLLTTRFIYWHAVCRHKINKQQLFIANRLMSAKDSSSSDSSDSDTIQNERIKKIMNKKPVERKEEDKQQTLDLLNSLLTKMTEEPAKTKTIRAIPKREPRPKPRKEPELEEKIIDAAKEAAAVLGGDKAKTEAELLDKIFSAGKPTVATQEPDAPKPTKPSDMSLEELFAGMKIERKPLASSSTGYELFSRSSRVQQLLRKQKPTGEFTAMSRSRRPDQPVNLYGGTRLSLFDRVTKTAPEDSQMLNRWKSLEKKELKLMLVHPPENVFEEMIQWTEKGILWKFPINNEIEMEEEESVHFSEHVFLERYLKGWCPKKGPIRHFMDLVCIGLSKNPYMTVQEKKNHILWYKEYFGEKQELLKEIGAIDNEIIPDKTNQIQP